MHILCFKVSILSCVLYTSYTIYFTGLQPFTERESFDYLSISYIIVLSAGTICTTSQCFTQVQTLTRMYTINCSICINLLASCTAKYASFHNNNSYNHLTWESDKAPRTQISWMLSSNSQCVAIPSPRLFSFLLK